MIYFSVIAAVGILFGVYFKGDGSHRHVEMFLSYMAVALGLSGLILERLKFHYWAVSGQAVGSMLMFGLWGLANYCFGGELIGFSAGGLAIFLMVTLFSMITAYWFGDRRRENPASQDRKFDR